MNRVLIFLFFCLAFTITNAQVNKFKIKTQKSPSGMEYKIFTSNKGVKITTGDLVFFKLKGFLSDSVLFNTYSNQRTPYMNIEVHEGFQKANFEDGLTLLTNQDSAVFLINADSFYNFYIGTPPPSFVRKGDPIYFFIKVDSVITKKVVAERRAMAERELQERQNNEQKIIDDYVKKDALVYSQTSTGLYYTVTKATNGEKAEKGDKVAAIYTGTLLNGKVFDSNASSGQPFEFTLGAHQVIAGWDEIFSILRVGEKAKIVLPSALGYGAQGAGADIGPYSPLVFEVEFVKFTKQ